jgi:hypothetical protein
LAVPKKDVILHSKTIKHMTTTTTTPVIKVNTDSVMSGDVFYGSFDTVIKGKSHKVLVSNHIKDVNKQYEFRVASKCQAGFINISDWTTTPKEVISGFKKNSLVNIQVKWNYENGKTLWFNVFTTKGGKWHSIDKGFMEVLSVGDMRQSFPDMCDMKLWEFLGAKTWADMAFIPNQK